MILNWQKNQKHRKIDVELGLFITYIMPLLYLTTQFLFFFIFMLIQKKKLKTFIKLEPWNRQFLFVSFFPGKKHCYA